MDVDELAIDFALAGYRMRLAGADRVEAVRRLTAAGVPTREVAWRLHLSPANVYAIRCRNHIRVKEPARAPA